MKPCVWKMLIVTCAASVGSAAVSDTFDLAELVRTSPVKFSLISVGLTREVEELSDTSDSVVQTLSGVIREYGSSYNRKNESHTSRASDYTSQNQVSWGIRGGLSWGLIPFGDVSGGVNDITSSGSSSHDSSSTDVFRKYNLDYKEKEGTIRVTEDNHRMRLGKYRISVKMEMCASRPDVRYHVGGPGASVIVEGLGGPITIPFNEQFELGVDRRVCELSRTLDDATLLSAVLANKDWRGVSVSLSGSHLPIVDGKGGNALLAEAEAEFKCKTAEFSACLDDDDLLSRRAPWRIRTTFPAGSGKKCARVTLRDALDGLGACLARDEEMPEKIFSYDASGALIGLCDTMFGKLRARGKLLKALAVCIAGDEQKVSMLPLSADFLEEKLRGNMSVRFVELDVKETAENLYGLGRVNIPQTDTSAVSAAKAAFRALAQKLAEAGDLRVREAIEEAEKRYADWVQEQDASNRKYIRIAGLTLIRIPGRRFAIGQTEVTQRQWYEIMGQNPAKWNETEDRPVESVSREDAQAFINKLNELPAVRNARLRFRLPNSEEWSFACRAGSAGAWGWVAEKESGSCDDMAWHKGNALGMTHPVGTKQPNRWDIYDMHGNVWEWLNDSVNGEFLLAGGSYVEGSIFCRADAMTSAPGDQRNSNVGFRVVAIEY